ncbi:MAG TPA: SDR family oxidoreductase [Candidatus Sulfotelmatobacter sp.]|nr:SDR family oxidoreductase [Candidatus Sulfotelmatobacter sp.]
MSVSNQKRVVITGASSGIGRSSVSRMVRSGWHVFATVRKAQDGDRLRSDFGTNITPVIMDVTNRASVTTAAEQIVSLFEDSGLDGLVNVAGVGEVRPVEYITQDDLQEIFDINVFGQIGVTQAFLPLLRSARGRIVNISSVGAHIAIPFGSLINATKSAFGIFNDTLRLELHPFGIHVSVVEPGAIKTPAVEKTLGDIETVIRSLPPKGAAQYENMLRDFVKRGYEREMNGSPPDVVAQAIQHALTAKRPRTRYRVGKHATLLATLAAFLPDRLLDTIRFRITGMPTEFGSEAPLVRKGLADRTCCSLALACERAYSSAGDELREHSQ